MSIQDIETIKSNKPADHKELLKQLIHKIYGVRQIDLSPKKGDCPKKFTIYIGGEDLVAKFKQTNTYLKHFKKIFRYSFLSAEGVTVTFEKQGDQSRYVNILIANVLKSFIGEETLNRILNTSAQRPKHKTYFHTKQSIFDVMADYDSFSGIPMICTDEQWELYQKLSDEQVEEDSSIDDETVPKWNFDKFCRQYQNIIKKFAEPIHDLLVEEMMPLFFDEDITEDMIESKYEQVCTDITEKLQVMFEDEVRKNIGKRNSADIVRQIVLVDPEYKMGEPKTTVIYCPDRVPILIDWHIPAHQYIRYHKPEFSNEDVKALIYSIVQDVPYQFNTVNPESDEAVITKPMSDVQIKYSQRMFQQFQIQYMTKENNPRFTPSFFEYLVAQDIFITADIEKRERETLRLYWESVFESITKILKSIFSIDFIALIYETPLKNDLAKSLSEIPETEYSGWLDMLNQQKLLLLNKDALPVFFSENLLMWHYSRQIKLEPPIYEKLATGDDITFTTDSINLIQEMVLEDYSVQEAERLEESAYSKWLDRFGQQRLLIWEEDVFSAFLSQDLILRHYLLQCEGTAKPYRDMMNIDYANEWSTRQLAYIIIPLIGEFVSELKSNVTKIADISKKSVTVEEFGGQLFTVGNYLMKYPYKEKLDEAIVQWNEMYDAIKKKRDNPLRMRTAADDNMLGLKKYADENGNLFQNLKDALEAYYSSLETVLKHYFS